MDTTPLDAQLRRQVYDLALHAGTLPTIADLADSTRVPADLVRESLTRLAAARVVVLQPASGEILMAPPFSAVPTPFVVHTSRHPAYANCAWDALGVPVMMREAGRIAAACGCCGESITLRTQCEGPPEGDATVVHFAVPARRWWDDIVFT